MIAYLMQGCRGCGDFWRLLQTSPRVLMQTDIRFVDDPKHRLEMHDLGATQVPVLVVQGTDGRRQMYQGPRATMELAKLL